MLNVRKLLYCSANMKNKLSEFPKKPIDKSFLPATIPKCGSCGGLILDRFILKARKNFIFYQISQRSDDLVLRWLTSRGTPNVSAAPLARNPSGRSALSRTGIFNQSQPITIIMLTHSSDVFCREDFFRKYGTKCAGCQEGIAPSSVVGNSGKH